MENLKKLKIEESKMYGAGIYKIQSGKYVFIGSATCLYNEYLEHLEGKRLNGITKQMLLSEEGEMTLLKEIDLSLTNKEEMKKEEQLYTDAYAMNYLYNCLNCYTQNILSEELRKENLIETLNRLISKIENEEIELTENQFKYIKRILGETVNKYTSNYPFWKRR